MANIDPDKLPVHGYAAAVFAYLGGEMVEINTGEIKTTHILDQFQHDIKHLIRGRLIDVIGDALIVECNTSSGQKKKLFINCWGIMAISKLDNASMSDVYWDADRTYVNK